jgi:hypothetical protein
MRRRCVGAAADESMKGRSEAAVCEGTLCWGEWQEQTHSGNNAQRGEREVEQVCWGTGIMVIDYVERGRSEGEFRSGTAGMLAKREGSTEAQWLVARLMKNRLVAKVVGVVGVLDPAWILKRG